MKMLTRKQKELFDFVNAYIDKTSISPSFEEMKNALGLKSKSGIHVLITSLEQRGFIKRLKHKARAMEILKKNNSLTPKTDTNELSIPLLGAISAGNPIEAINSENELIAIPSNMINKNFLHFGLVVKGESMIGEGIMDGDIAIIKHTKTIDNGKIAAILVKGEEVTIKKFKSEGSLIKLIPANSEYKEKTYSSSDIEIQGELKGLIRKYN